MGRVQTILALGAFLLAAGCGEEKPLAPATASAPAPAPPSAVPTTDSSLTITGPIIVEHQLDLSSQRDGIVLKIYVDTAARVKAGSLLAELDNRQMMANLEAARSKTRGIAADLKNWESEAEVLKADYVRAQRLWDLGLISEEQLQHAKYKAESDQWDIKRVSESLNTARQEERSLELELEKTRITAPFDGLVARRYVREGQSVARGERLFWITAEAPLLMRFTLPEKLFGHVRHGQTFEITSPDVPGEKHNARVRDVSPVVDPASGTFEVLVELVGDRGSFRPGMTAAVHLSEAK